MKPMTPTTPPSASMMRPGEPLTTPLRATASCLAATPSSSLATLVRARDRLPRDAGHPAAAVGAQDDAGVKHLDQVVD